MGIGIIDSRFSLGVIVLLLYFKPEIEDLSGASLATLFTWRTLWVPALVTIFLFLLIGLLPGKLFSSIPVTQVFHRFTGYRAYGNIRCCLYNLQELLSYWDC